MKSLLPFIFILACPLMMIGMMFMHRSGGHGAHGHDTASDHAADHGHPAGESLDDLLDSRDELYSRLEALDARIDTLEQKEINGASKAAIGA